MPLDTLGCTRATLIASKSSLGEAGGTSGAVGGNSDGLAPARAPFHPCWKRPGNLGMAIVLGIDHCNYWS